MNIENQKFTITLTVKQMKSIKLNKDQVYTLFGTDIHLDLVDIMATITLPYKDLYVIQADLSNSGKKEDAETANDINDQISEEINATKIDSEYT